MDSSEKFANRVTMAGMVVIIIVLGIWNESQQTKTGTFEQQREETKESEPNYHLFRTDVQEDYLNFLSNLPKHQYTIVGISNSMAVENYGSDEFYMVTYRNRVLGDPILISGQSIKIFRTVEENEFFDFMEDLSENQKLINVSTSMNLGSYGSDEFYIVTYGEN